VGVRLVPGKGQAFPGRRAQVLVTIHVHVHVTYNYFAFAVALPPLQPLQ
jgi:hypothetical protein